MSEAVLAAIIAGVCAIISNAIISRSSTKALTKELYAELDKRQAVTDVKLEELTRETREHNNFARRVPVLEEKVAQLEKKG